MMKTSRRDFLKTVGTASGASTALPIMGSLLAMNEAAANVATDYKALVCVYMAGGNDAFNTVVYHDAVNRAVYQAKRTNTSLSTDSVVALDNTEGPALALNKRLSYLAKMFKGTASDTGRLAIVANVGPLKDMVSNNRGNLSRQTLDWPPKLYSHNDQTSVWLTSALEGDAPGWGGGLIDAHPLASVYPADAAPFQSISMDHASAFGSYGAVNVFAASSISGAVKPASIAESQDEPLFGSGVALPDASYLLPILQGFEANSPTRTPHLLEQVYENKMALAYSQWEYLRDGDDKKLTIESYPNTPEGPALFQQPFTEVVVNGTETVTVTRNDGVNDLWRQLAMVAQIIRSSQEIGVKRQVFFVQLGGFDTHSGQARGASDHDQLMTTLNNALQRFDQTLGGLRDQVTTFTASEFGRKLLENGNGTDHGWGGHHFVMGGTQVNGGHVYGRMPSLALDTNGAFADSQLLADGTMIPEVSVHHFGAELAQWFGVPPDAIANIFPVSQDALASGIGVDFMVNE